MRLAHIFARAVRQQRCQHAMICERRIGLFADVIELVYGIAGHFGYYHRQPSMNPLGGELSYVGNE